MCEDCAVIFSELDEVANAAASFIEKFFVRFDSEPLTDFDIKAGITQTVLSRGKWPAELMDALLRRTKQKLQQIN